MLEQDRRRQAFYLRRYGEGTHEKHPRQVAGERSDACRHDRDEARLSRWLSLDEWPEATKHRRDEFGDRRMNVHRTLEERGRLAGVHCSEDAVDRFIASSSQNRCTQNPLALRVDQHFDESLRLALLSGTAYPGYRPCSDECRASAQPHLTFGQAHLR